MTGETMKSITLKCKDCSKTKKFIGIGVRDIITKIDKANWRDMPDNEALCPACSKVRDAEYQDDWWD